MIQKQPSVDNNYQPFDQIGVVACIRKVDISNDLEPDEQNLLHIRHIVDPTFYHIVFNARFKELTS